jgi:hypothetical protein
LKKLSDTGEAEQFLRPHYGVFQPDFLFFKVFVGFWFKVNLLRSEISGAFQVIEIVTDLLGCKQTSDFSDEGRHLGSERGIALGRVQEGEEFLADQIVQRILQAEIARRLNIGRTSVRSMVVRGGRKPSTIGSFRRPVSRAYYNAPCLWPQSILFGHADSS